MPFPPPEKNAGRVWNPMARPGWDILILGLIFVVMVLAPLKLRFCRKLPVLRAGGDRASNDRKLPYLWSTYSWISAF